MGCDAHVFAEIKIDGNWEHAGEIEMGRNYSLFSCMVDGHQRGNCKGVAHARGLPKDVNPYTKLILEEDMHTHSWLTYKECLKVNKLYHKQVVEPETLYDMEPGDYKPFTIDSEWNCYPCPIDDSNFRVVFAFDS